VITPSLRLFSIFNGFPLDGLLAAGLLIREVEQEENLQGDASRSASKADLTCRRKETHNLTKANHPKGWDAKPLA